jgi:hypothetical protein
MRAIVADLTYTVGKLVLAVRRIDALTVSLYGMVLSLKKDDDTAY